MGGRVNGLFYVLVGSLVGSLVTIGITLGAGTASACVTATGTAVVDCDGMLQSDLSGSTIGAVDGHGGGADGQGVETLPGMGEASSSQGENRGVTQMCGAGAPGSVPRC